jgi:hypothetical protein
MPFHRGTSVAPDRKSERRCAGGAAEAGGLRVGLLDALAVVVVTPQDVAHLDNRRIIAALGRSGIRLLGGIENMSGLHRPSCDAHIAGRHCGK